MHFFCMGFLFHTIFHIFTYNDRLLSPMKKFCYR